MTETFGKRNPARAKQENCKKVKVVSTLAQELWVIGASVSTSMSAFALSVCRQILSSQSESPMLLTLQPLIPLITPHLRNSWFLCLMEGEPESIYSLCLLCSHSSGCFILSSLRRNWHVCPPHLLPCAFSGLQTLPHPLTACTANSWTSQSLPPAVWSFSVFSRKILD